MANGVKKQLKAFVRYDAQERIVPGSLIFRKNKPAKSAGNFVELKNPSIDVCCPVVPTPTSTTTTTAPAPVILTTELFQYSDPPTDLCLDVLVFSCDTGGDITTTSFSPGLNSDTMATIVSTLNASYSSYGTWYSVSPTVLELEVNPAFVASFCSGGILSMAGYCV